jgi:hypothetical protein
MNKEKIRIQNQKYSNVLKNRKIEDIIIPENLKCPKCKILKSNKDFYKANSKFNGLSTYCKICTKQNNNKFYNNSKEKRLEYQKDYTIRNSDKIREKAKKYYCKNKERIRQYKKEWQEKNKEDIAKKQKEYRESHKDKRKSYNKNRKNNDIGYKILCNLRTRLNRAVKPFGLKKSNSTLLLVGCTINELKEHLKSKFIDNMTFNNYGVGPNKWSLDHIIPCAAFDLSDPKQQKECFHYLNIRPLWNIDNFKKNSLYNERYIRNKQNKKE